MRSRYVPAVSCRSTKRKGAMGAAPAARGRGPASVNIILTFSQFCNFFSFLYPLICECCQYWATIGRNDSYFLFQRPRFFPAPGPRGVWPARLPRRVFLHFVPVFPRIFRVFSGFPDRKNDGWKAKNFSVLVQVFPKVLACSPGFSGACRRAGGKNCRILTWSLRILLLPFRRLIRDNLNI